MKFLFVPRSTSRRYKTAVIIKLANHRDIDYVIYFASGNALRIHDVVQNYFPSRRRIEQDLTGTASFKEYWNCKAA